jgi:cytochrome c-type biogenesis protein CcmE|tara:strand:- start:856 stop:1260 length:405 start_codon:yes stop_codon:yes gene_type:complete
MVGLIVVGCTIATGLALLALQENINLFFSPSQIVDGTAPSNTTIRLGGMVVSGSIQRGENLGVTFVLTDLAEQVTVAYEGILPDLFREGQGIVTQGKLDSSGRFFAEQVLAKHDETYMPPEVNDALRKVMEVGQ